MALEVKSTTKVVTATNLVSGYSVDYRAEHEEGAKPDTIRGRATQEGSAVIFDIILFKEGNIQISMQNVDSVTDKSPVLAIITELYELFDLI